MNSDKSDKPLVSIITPSYNQGSYIEDCICSIIEQDYPNIEHIIIDGGSSDETLNVIKKYENRLAFWLSEKDCGSADGINKGFLRATGEYIWILNSDDILATPGAISEMVNFLETNVDVDFVYGDMFYVNEHKTKIGQRVFPKYSLLTLLLENDQYPFAGCLMRRRVLDTVGYFDIDFRSANDIDYFFRMACYHNMGHLEKFTAYFRIHPQASTQARLDLAGEETLMVYQKFLQSSYVPDGILKNKNKILGVAYQRAAGFFFRFGLSKRAFSNTLKAIRYNPAYMLNPKIWIILCLSLLGDEQMVRARRVLSNIISYWSKFLKRD